MDLSSPNTLSLILPAYNEAENLPIVVHSAKQILPTLFDDFEIIIINDGSKDRTAMVAENLARENHHIHVLHHDKNLGIGAVFRTAFKASRFSWVFTCPSDNQFDIGEIKEFIPLMEKADVILGCRTNLDYTLYRKFNHFVYKTLIRLLFSLKSSDLAWVKMFRREVVKSLPIETDGFFGEIEILARAKRAGFHLANVLVHTRPRLHGKPVGGNFKRVIRTFLELLYFRLKF